MYSLEQICEFPIFCGFTPEQVERVLSCATEQWYDKGTVLIEESASCSEFYVVINGRVDVEIQAYSQLVSSGSSKRLAMLRVGDIFGEMAYVENRRRAARVSAVDDVNVLCLVKDELDKIFEFDPKLGFLFMRNIARIISQRLIDLNFMWRDDV